jgi:hypothetical protein
MECMKETLAQSAVGKARISIRSFASASILVCGLLLPTALSAEGLPSRSGKLSSGVCAEKVADPLGSLRVRKLRRFDGSISQYRIEGRFVTHGHGFTLPGIGGQEPRIEVVSVTRKGVGVSIDGGSARFIYYSGAVQADDIVPGLRLSAQKCSKGAALLTVTYPAAQEEDGLGSRECAIASL